MGRGWKRVALDADIAPVPYPTPPEEFEREANAAVNSAGATMSFFRHEEGANWGML